MWCGWCKEGAITSCCWLWAKGCRENVEGGRDLRAIIRWYFSDGARFFNFLAGAVCASLNRHGLLSPFIRERFAILVFIDACYSRCT